MKDGRTHFSDLSVPVQGHTYMGTEVPDRLGRGDRRERGGFTGPEDPALVGPTVSVHASDPSLDTIDLKVVFFEKPVDHSVHGYEISLRGGEDGRVVTVTTGVNRRGLFFPRKTLKGVPPNILKGSVELIEHNCEEKGGERATLLYGLVNVDHRGDTSSPVGAHHEASSL